MAATMSLSLFGLMTQVAVATWSAVETLDLAAVDPDLKGFIGGFADATHGYLVPFNNGGGRFGKVARFALGAFAPASVEVLDLAAVDPDLKGFIGGFADATHGYLVPNNNGDGSVGFGKVARFALGAFAPASVEVLDLAAVDPDLKGFIGGFADATHGYLVPFGSGDGSVRFGKVARFALGAFAPASVEVLDLAAVDPDLKGFMFGFADATHGYLVPYKFGKVARFNIAAAATTTMAAPTTTEATTSTAAVRLETSCTPEYLICPLPAEQSHLNYVVLGSEEKDECRAMFVDGQAIVNASVHTCNVTRDNETSPLSVTLNTTLVLPMGTLVLGRAPVIHCGCVAELGGWSVGAWQVASGGGGEEQLTGKSEFKATPLAVFTDGGFSQELPAGAPLPGGSRWYLEAASEDPLDLVGVVRCTASPTAALGSPYESLFLKDSCPVGLLDLQHHSGGARHAVRFSVLAFSFFGTPDIYIRCSVIRCVAPPCGQCGGSGGRRLTPAGADASAETVVTRALVAPPASELHLFLPAPTLGDPKGSSDFLPLFRSGAAPREPKARKGVAVLNGMPEAALADVGLFRTAFIAAMAAQLGVPNTAVRVISIFTTRKGRASRRLAQTVGAKAVALEYETIGLEDGDPRLAAFEAKLEATALSFTHVLVKELQAALGQPMHGLFAVLSTLAPVLPTGTAPVAAATPANGQKAGGGIDPAYLGVAVFATVIGILGGWLCSHTWGRIRASHSRARQCGEGAESKPGEGGNLVGCGAIPRSGSSKVKPQSQDEEGDPALGTGGSEFPDMDEDGATWSF